MYLMMEVVGNDVVLLLFPSYHENYSPFAFLEFFIKPQQQKELLDLSPPPPIHYKLHKQILTYVKTTMKITMRIS
jgi:hypothetical protein